MKKYLHKYFVPIGIIILFTIKYTLGGPAMICFAAGLCLGSLSEQYGFNG